MSTPLVVTNIVLVAGAALLAIASLIKLKHFYFGGKSEYFTQIFYSGVALVTLAVIALLIAYSQFDVPTEQLIMGREELRQTLNI